MIWPIGPIEWILTRPATDKKRGLEVAGDSVRKMPRCAGDQLASAELASARKEFRTDKGHDQLSILIGGGIGGNLPIGKI